jgi:hydrogenase nickel incorporation protein HypA/HybF
MHEINYAMTLLEAIEKATRAADGGTVALVKVRLGLARGVSPAALRAAFDWIKPGTTAETATLVIEAVPATIRCTLCDHTHVTEDVFDECPHCGALGGEVLSGDEFSIVGLAMEEVEALTH